MAVNFVVITLSLTRKVLPITAPATVRNRPLDQMLHSIWLWFVRLNLLLLLPATVVNLRPHFVPA